MATLRYIGYSSEAFERTGSFRITNIDVIKEDLLNHIYTRKGSRPRMNNYGTDIPDMTFEMLDEDLLEHLYDELNRVFESDPRIRTLQLNVVPQYETNSVQVVATVLYVELNVQQTIDFNIVFNEG